MDAEIAAEIAPGARFGPHDDQYEIGKQLGHGAASQVFACRHKDGRWPEEGQQQVREDLALFLRVMSACTVSGSVASPTCWLCAAERNLGSQVTAELANRTAKIANCLAVAPKECGLARAPKQIGRPSWHVNNGHSPDGWRANEPQLLGRTHVTLQGSPQLRLRDGEELAVKTVDLRRLCLLGDMQEQLGRLDSEVGILQELRHERIVNLQSFHKTENWYFLVMELVGGGELFDVIVRNKSLTEMEARHIFLQLLEGVGYMHSIGVIHRDLKPENILVANSRPHTEGQLHDVKIADFGLSKAIGGGASLARTRVGTPQYWAPEVLDVQKRGGSYDQAADFWGLGAVLFVMLCGRYPFDGQKQPLDDQIRTASYCMSGSRWRGISEAAKSLVRGLLRVNPVDRLSWEECLTHPWVTGQPMMPKTQMSHFMASREAPGDRGMAAIAEHSTTGAEAQLTKGMVSGETERAASTSCCSVSEIGSRSGSRAVSSPSSPEPDTRQGLNFSPFGVALSMSFFWSKDLRRRRYTWALLLLLAMVLYGAQRMRSDPREKLLPAEVPDMMNRPSLEKPTDFNNLSAEGTEKNFLAALDQSPFFYFAGLDRPTEALPMLEASTKDPYQQSGSLFRLAELLKLQISIAGSLEMANLAVRHVDTELAEATKHAYQQATGEDKFSVSRGANDNYYRILKVS
eukprot:symbB.v1.2.014603.t1/scaffold1071.1/size202461/16